MEKSIKTWKHLEPEEKYTVVVYVKEQYPSTGYSAGGQHVRPIRRTFSSKEAYDGYCLAIEDVKGIVQILTFTEHGDKKTVDRGPGDRQVDAGSTSAGTGKED